MRADPSQLYQILSNLGYSPAAAAGILGNAKQESAFNTSASGDNGTAYGLWQWRGNRRAGLNNFASQNGLDASSPEAQARYLDWELRNKEKTAFSGLQRAQTPREAVAAMMHFERPAGYSPQNPLAGDGAGNRLSAADQYYRQFSGQPAGQPTSAAIAAPRGLLALAGQPPAGEMADAASAPVAAKPEEPAQDFTGLLSRLFPQSQPEQAAPPPQQEDPLGLLANFMNETPPPVEIKPMTMRRQRSFA